MVDRVSGKYGPDEPARVLLVPEGRDAIRSAEIYGMDHPSETPFKIVRWSGFPELTLALRGIYYSAR